MRRGIALTVAATVTVTVASIGLATWHGAVFAGARHDQPAPPADEPTIANGVATFQRTARIGDVAAACTETANAESPGAVALRNGLDDSHVSVTFTVPCAIQLAGGGFALRGVHVSSRTLNISDTAFGPGPNSISLYDTRFTGTSDAGLLVTLSDPADQVTLTGGSLRYPAGIAVQVRGDRSGVDTGGTVQVSHIALSARGAGSAGIEIAASTKQGSIVGSQLQLDADAISFVADRCKVTQGPRVVDCGAARLAKDLKAQAAKP